MRWVIAKLYRRARAHACKPTEQEVFFFLFFFYIYMFLFLFYPSRKKLVFMTFMGYSMIFDPEKLITKPLAHLRAQNVIIL